MPIDGLVIPVPAGYSRMCVVLCVFVRCHRRSEPFFDGIDARYHAIVNLPPCNVFTLKGRKSRDASKSERNAKSIKKVFTATYTTVWGDRNRVLEGR